MSSNQINMNNIAYKIIAVVMTILIGGFAWWMTTVWANQTEQARQISVLEARLAGLENKVDGVSHQVNDVKNSVDKLLNIALGRNR